MQLSKDEICVPVNARVQILSKKFFFFFKCQMENCARVETLLGTGTAHVRDCLSILR